MQVQEISARELAKITKYSTLLDVREVEELLSGYIPGAINLPLSQLRASTTGGTPAGSPSRRPRQRSEAAGGTPAGSAKAEAAEKIRKIIPKSEKGNIYVYCQRGRRSKEAVRLLQELGIDKKRLYHLEGGVQQWIDAGAPLQGIRRSQEDLEAQRYARQIRLPEVGPEGQNKINNASVLVVGAGGLGAPLLMYLAAAGIGKIGIVDDDHVDITNLQRQVIHDSEKIGLLKTESAAETIKRLNPNVNIKLYNEKIDVDNRQIVKNYDVIVDGVDNLRTRYILNEACVEHDRPLVSASVLAFEAQLSVFHYKDGPCYRCLYPEPPPYELVPSCNIAGVLGTVPGVVGVLQVTEVLKIILELSGVLAKHLLVYDAINVEFNKFKTHKDSSCPTCGIKKGFNSLLPVLAVCD